MQKSHFRWRLNAACHPDPDPHFAFGNADNASDLRNRMEFIEAELEKGYRKEAVTMRQTLEILTRDYLTRLQSLQKELKRATYEYKLAEEQRQVAQKERRRLLEENWQLLRTLQHLRYSIQKPDRHHQQQGRSRTPLHVTNWKQVSLRRNPQQQL